MKRIRTKYKGVYQREGLNRKNGNKKDVAYDITYRDGARKVWEKCGWESEGYSAKLANDIRAERLRSLRHGEELPKKKQKSPLMKDVWEEYKQWAATNKTRQGFDDISRYNCHIKDRFESKRLSEISSFDLERVKAELAKEGLSPATAKHVLVLIRQLFNKSKAWGMYHGPNPIQSVKMPTVVNQRTRFLSHTEVDTLLKALRINTRKKEKTEELEDPWLHDAALLALHTGMRAGEIFSLKGYDVDLENGVITIRDPKNKTTRFAYMTESVRDILENRKPDDPNRFIFLDKDGGQVKRVSKRYRLTVNELFNQEVRDPRERVIFHTLRHTFASWLAIRGETLQTIADLLGHKDLSMTRRYSHLSPDHKRRAILNLEKAFNGKKNETVITMQ